MTVHRIQLDNAEFEGQNDVYLLDWGTTALVDTGIATDEAWDDLRAGLNRHGTAVADVDRVFLTHWHADHAGLAGRLQRESGASVHVHEADAPLVEHDDAALDALDARRSERFETWGMPHGKRDELRAFLDRHEPQRGEPVEATTFGSDAAFAVGDRTLDALHLPGHTAGLTGFVAELDGERVLFSGDALLPSYTPNVGGADVRVERPLAAYLETLDRIASGGFNRALPGHRDPIDRPADRARAIRDHHRDRSVRVVDAVEALGRADAWAVSDRLFGSLDGVHVLHGPGEAAAHLEHLADGSVLRESDGAYTLAPDAEEGAADLWPDADAP